ncbi:MAG: peptidoglycan DD-metalloendopeptidase family protein [Candidatus Paceibacterota bacterium]
MRGTKDGLNKKSLLFCFLGTLAVFASFSLAGAQNSAQNSVKSIKTTSSHAGVLLSVQTAVEPAQNVILLAGGSLKSISSPVFVKPQTLAAMIVSQEDSGDSENGEKDIIQYTVKDGDTITSLSGKFGISAETILWANELKKGSPIKTGQKLVILPVSGVMHIIEEKETLSQIAKSYSAKQDEIISFNQIDPRNDLMVGDILVIPGGKITAAAPVIKPSVLPSNPANLASSLFIIPTTGSISQGAHLYNAVDIANVCGTPVFAAAGGKIQLSTNAWPYGVYVRILHPNNVVTLYAHLSRSLVAAGQDVSQGQLIGYIGNTGHVIGITGCHLHFEVRGASNPFIGYGVGAKLTLKK